MSDNLASYPVTQVLGKAGLAAGTTTTYSITANPLVYAIRSKLYSKATVSNGATPTVDAVDGLAFAPVPVNSGSVFVFGYDAGGTIRVAQGSIEALDASGNFVLAPQFPVVPDTIAGFGYLVVKVGATGAAWTLGTSNLAGPPSGVTFAFQDVTAIPDRPQVS